MQHIARVNTDMQLLVDYELVGNYISKYVTKQEPPSKEHGDLLRLAAKKEIYDRHLLLRKIALKTFSSRDMGNYNL